MDKKLIITRTPIDFYNRDLENIKKEKTKEEKLVAIYEINKQRTYNYYMGMLFREMCKKNVMVVDCLIESSYIVDDFCRMVRGFMLLEKREKEKRQMKDNNYINIYNYRLIRIAGARLRELEDA